MNTSDSFFQKVYKVVEKIPKGRVTTYGAIAEYLGSKKSARMVGWALNSSNSFPTNIPAHRVVNRNGLLTGKNYFGGTNVMSDLLRSEGIEVENNRVEDLSNYFWSPADKA